MNGLRSRSAQQQSSASPQVLQQSSPTFAAHQMSYSPQPPQAEAFDGIDMDEWPEDMFDDLPTIHQDARNPLVDLNQMETALDQLRLTQDLEKLHAEFQARQNAESGKTSPVPEGRRSPTGPEEHQSGWKPTPARRSQPLAQQSPQQVRTASSSPYTSRMHSSQIQPNSPVLAARGMSQPPTPSSSHKVTFNNVLGFVNEIKKLNMDNESVVVIHKPKGTAEGTIEIQSSHDFKKDHPEKSEQKRLKTETENTMKELLKSRGQPADRTMKEATRTAEKNVGSYLNNNFVTLSKVKAAFIGVR